MSTEFDIRLSLIKDQNSENTTKAFASVGINNIVCIRGIRVVEGEDGLFMSMPQSRGADNKYYDIAFPLTKELRDDMSKAVLAEYAAVKEKSAKNNLQAGLKAGAAKAASYTPPQTGAIAQTVQQTA